MDGREGTEATEGAESTQGVEGTEGAQGTENAEGGREIPGNPECPGCVGMRPDAIGSMMPGVGVRSGRRGRSGTDAAMVGAGMPRGAARSD